MAFKFIKNTTGGDKTYLGQLISSGQYYQIQPSELVRWQNDSTLLTDIGSSDAVVAKADDGTEDISDVAEGINYLKDIVGKTDADGVPLSRTKVTESGWHFELYSIEATSGLLGSLSNKDAFNAALSHASLKFYDSNDVELVSGTQAELDTLCVRTVIEWEPDWDYEIIGGQFRQLSLPGSDIFMSVVAVPDVPAAYGGSVPFVSNLNLRYVGNEDSLNTDGRTSKKLVYDNVNHTNKLQINLYHGLAVNHKMQISFEIFRA